MNDGKQSEIKWSITDYSEECPVAETVKVDPSYHCTSDYDMDCMAQTRMKKKKYSVNMHEGQISGTRAIQRGVSNENTL